MVHIANLSLEDTWIKAAVEHVVVKIKYYSGKTKHELTEREVEPDLIGTSRDGKNSGYWATFCHLRGEGSRCFKVRWGQTLSPISNG